jgi:hypothetical protein
MVKMITHYVFSFGVVAIMLAPLLHSWWLVFPALVVALFTNVAIDLFGHEGEIVPRRTALTHSIVYAPVWGVGVGAAFGLIMYILTRGHTPIAPISVGVLGGVISSLSHLFGDSLTQGGIYVPTDRRKNVRWRLASYKYNNPMLNLGLIALGLGLLYLANLIIGE